MVYIKHTGTLTITVSRMVDGDFALTRMRDMKRVAENLWCVSWLGACNQLRKWNVNDDGIQNVEHQLTAKPIAVVQLRTLFDRS